jgi:hypothetical protein
MTMPSRWGKPWRVNDAPHPTTNLPLLAAWRLRLQAGRHGICLGCGAIIQELEPSQQLAYQLIGRTPPVTMTHDTDCPASGETLRRMTNAGWS